MEYNKRNVEMMLKKYLKQSPSEYDYDVIPKEWFGIAIDWLKQNEIHSLTEEKVFIGTSDNLKNIYPFNSYKISGISFVCLYENEKYFPFVIGWFTDYFKKLNDFAVKKEFIVNKLLMIDDPIFYEYCNNPLIVIFHELGHWVVYDYFCSKFMKMGKDFITVERYSNQYIWRMFGENKLIDDNSIENSAEWFVMYALNPTFTKKHNPKVFKFFSEKVGIKPFLDVSRTTLKEWTN